MRNKKGKQATQQNKAEGCSEQVVESMSENSASDYETSDGGKETTNMPKSKVTGLIHNVEEARPLEFFTGYENSDDLGIGSTSSRLPDFFVHYKPFLSPMRDEHIYTQVNFPAAPLFFLQLFFL